MIIASHCACRRLYTYTLQHGPILGINTYLYEVNDKDIRYKDGDLIYVHVAVISKSASRFPLYNSLN